MTLLKIVEPELGAKNSVADPRIPAALKEIEKVVNGELEGTNNIKAEGILEANLSAAVQTLLNQKSSGLTVVSHAISATAVSGELALMTKTGTTLELPAPTIGRNVGVYYAESAGSITVKASTGAIAGDFLSATSCKLAANQHLYMIADGAFWRIMGGEPKRETAWEAQVARANETLYTPSASRETEVLVELFGGSGGSQAEIYVGGTKIAFLTAASPTNRQSVGFRVGAGVAWQVKQFEAIGSPPATVKSSYRSC